LIYAKHARRNEHGDLRRIFNDLPAREVNISNCGAFYCNAALLSMVTINAFFSK